MNHITKTTKAQALEIIRKAVTLAKSLCDDVEFSPMDAGRADPAFLVEVCALAVQCGATTLNIPDTVGYVTPEEWQETISNLINETPGAGRGAVLSGRYTAITTSAWRPPTRWPGCWRGRVRSK